MTNALPIAVTGNGIAGLLAALMIVRSGRKVVICAPHSSVIDGRSSALLNHSIDYLKHLDIWNDLKANAFPLRTMRIIDGTKRLFRAPQTDFSSREIGLEAFGYNLLNSALGEKLHSVLKGYPDLVFISKKVSDVVPSASAVKITFEDGDSIEAAMIIGADGRNSVVRQSLAITSRKWSYPQTAIVMNLGHSLDHHDISTEFHTETGPFTLVPLGKKQSGLVCVETADTANRLLHMDKSALSLEFEKRCHSILGKIEILTKPQAFPLSGMIANLFGKDNAVLVGEAGHAFPPIGAQGLNLGIRDIEALEKLLLTHTGDSYATIGAAYHRNRFADVNTRTLSVDLLNRTLLSDFLPVQIARSLGLFNLGAIGPLRRFMMHEGVEPGRGFKSALSGNRTQETAQTRY